MEPTAFITTQDLNQATKTINLNGAVIWTRDEAKIAAKRKSLHELYERYWPEFVRLVQKKQQNAAEAPSEENKRLQEIVDQNLTKELRIAASMVHIYQQSILKLDEQQRIRDEMDAEDSE